MSNQTQKTTARTTNTIFLSSSKTATTAGATNRLSVLRTGETVANTHNNNTGEEKINHHSSSSLVESYINFVRVSLATAIIKNKPESVKSGEAYAEALCQQLKDQQNDWKQEYQRVKHEFLCLKQAQVLKGHSSVEKPDCVLTPPETQESGAYGPSQAGSSIIGETSQTKLASHHTFLTRIAAMKDFTSGSLVILNSAALPTVIETFIDSLEAVKDSLLSTSNCDEECSDMRGQLTRCMVELLNMSAGVSRCRQVQNELDTFLQVCIQRILSPPEPISDESVTISAEVSRILKILSKYPPNALSLCKHIMKRVGLLTESLVSASFKKLAKNRSLLSEAENVPKVTAILLTAHRLRMKSANSMKLDPFISLLDLMNLRENLNKTLSDFPLYTIHIREVLSKTGHKLPTDGEWSDTDV